MCIRDRSDHNVFTDPRTLSSLSDSTFLLLPGEEVTTSFEPVSYTHLRAHETVLDLVCRLLLEKKIWTSDIIYKTVHNLYSNIYHTVVLRRIWLLIA